MCWGSWKKKKKNEEGNGSSHVGVLGRERARENGSALRVLGELEEKEKKEERNGDSRVGVLGRERAGENE